MAEDGVRSPRSHAGAVHVADAGACRGAENTDQRSGAQKDMLTKVLNFDGACKKNMAGLSSLCYNCRMEKKVYTTDELNNASREDLVGIILSLQGSIARMMENPELIMEQISLLRQQRFGRHSERMDVIDGQISLFFNEPEADAAQPGSGAQEPELEEVVIRRKKENGKTT